MVSQHPGPRPSKPVGESPWGFKHLRPHDALAAVVRETSRRSCISTVRAMCSVPCATSADSSSALPLRDRRTLSSRWKWRPPSAYPRFVRRRRMQLCRVLLASWRAPAPVGRVAADGSSVTRGQTAGVADSSGRAAPTGTVLIAPRLAHVQATNRRSTFVTTGSPSHGAGSGHPGGSTRAASVRAPSRRVTDPARVECSSSAVRVTFRPGRRCESRMAAVKLASRSGRVAWRCCEGGERLVEMLRH
jgi:hypothetical protein